MHAVVETIDYLSDAKADGLTEAERRKVVDTLAYNPTAGDRIKGTGGARKLGVAGRGHGKSGGYCVITYFGGGDIPVFLLAVFAKGDNVNLSQAERNTLKKELADLADDYRAHAAKQAKYRGRKGS